MHNRNITFYFKIFFAELIVLIFYVWQCTQVTKMKYQINRLEKEICFLENGNRYSKVRLNNLTSLKRVEKIAKVRLGLIYPNKDDVIIIFE